MKTHRPLLWIFVCFAAGIVINEYVHPPFGLMVNSTIVVILMSFLLKNDFLSKISLCFMIVLGGALYARAFCTLPWDHIVRLTSSVSGPVTIEGVVVSDVQKRESAGRVKTVFNFEVKNFNKRFASGKILVNVFRDMTETIHYGDRIVLEGKLHRPFDFAPEDRFSYREYLERKGIQLILSVKKKGEVRVLGSHQGSFVLEAALLTRKRLKEILTTNLSVVEAGIMNALILGERYDIPEEIRDLFVLTGTAHILAISGFNVGIVASLLFLFLKVLRFPRSGQYLLTILLLIFYAFMTGGQPPVVRATIMAIVFLMSFLLERESDSINTLSLAALLIVLINPLSLFEVGFQLSFVSVLFIILFYMKFSKALERLSPRIPVFLMQSLAVSCVAWLGVLGLVAYYFEIITPVTILANLLIVPIVSVLTALGLGLMLCGSLWPLLNICFVPLIKVFLNILVYLAFLFSQIPGGFFFIKNVSIGQVSVYYIFIVIILRLSALVVYDDGPKIDPFDSAQGQS